MKIKKGDKIQVLQGKDRGKTGVVDQVLSKENSVIVGGVNIYKKHMKPKSEQDQSSGGIIDKIRPLAVSKVGLICPKCGKLTRVGYSLDKNSKSRICRNCKEII